VADSLVKNGFRNPGQIIWAKERLVIGRGDDHWQHEPFWYAVRSKRNRTGDRKQRLHGRRDRAAPPRHDGQRG
jgi:hypothetical protein